MSDGENKESGPSPSQTPGVWLPPRLRDRLEHADDPPPKSTGGALAAIGLVLILALAGAGLWWMSQRRAAEAKVEVARVQAERAAAVADSLALIAAADSVRAVAEADSVAAFLKLPEWKQQQILARASGAPADSESVAAGEGNLDEEGRFVVDAGTFLFEDAAQSAATAIKAGTRLELRIVTVEADGNPSYHVYLGNFSQRGAAAHAADQLFNKGTITQAKVVKLDPK